MNHAQSTALEQKRFDLRSLSPALRNLWFLLVIDFTYDCSNSSRGTRGSVRAARSLNVRHKVITLNTSSHRITTSVVLWWLRNKLSGNYFFSHTAGSIFFCYLWTLIKFSLLNNEYKKYTILKTTTELQNAKHPNKCHYTLLSLKPSKLQIVIETFLFCCFWTSEFGRVCLKSAISFTFSALSFFIFFILKHGLDCSYRASKSRRNTDMGG